MPSRWWQVCTKKSGDSTVLFLAHSSPTWAPRLQLRQISTRGKLCSVCGLPDQANPMVLQFEPHQLRKMGASQYLRHGQSKHNQPRSCHGVHEWQLHCSQNQQCSPPWLWTRHMSNTMPQSDGGAIGLTQSPRSQTLNGRWSWSFEDD